MPTSGITKALFGSLVLMAALGRPSHAETLNLYTPNPTPIMSVKDMTKFADEVDKKTNGQLKIKIHLGGSLQIQSTDIGQAVADDIIQIGDDQLFASTVPIAGILRLPALIRTREEFDKVLPIVEPYVKEQYAKRGIVLLASYYYPPLVLFSKKKIASLAELKGAKIRSLSPESAEWLKRLGASPVTLAFPEIAPALERSTVDGVLTAAAGAGYPLRDLVKFNFLIPLAFTQIYVITNQVALDRMTPETRKVFMETFAAGIPTMSPDIFKDDIELTKKMQDGGMQVIEPSKADYEESQRVMAAYWDDWAKQRGPQAVEALGKVRAVLQR